jgi:hypothetical protein
VTEPSTALVPVDPTEGGKYCGALARSRGPGLTCRQVSGYGTDHVGQGRCKFHGGATPITSGRGSRNTSRYHVVTRPRIAELIEHFEQDLDPLNLLPELHLGRAILVDFIERYDVWREAFLAWHFDYSAKYEPISEEKRLAFIAVIDEHENLLREQGDDATATQLENLKLAREYVDRIADPILVTAPKPREVLDVSAAMELAESVTKMVERHGLPGRRRGDAPFRAQGRRGRGAHRVPAGPVGFIVDKLGIPRTRSAGPRTPATRRTSGTARRTRSSRCSKGSAIGRTSASRRARARRSPTPRPARSSGSSPAGSARVFTFAPKEDQLRLYIWRRSASCGRASTALFPTRCSPTSRSACAAASTTRGARAATRSA